MKAQNLIAILAATLLTAASLGAVTYNTGIPSAPAKANHSVSIIDLAPIQVRPSAAELRAAALLPEFPTLGSATLPSLVASDDASQGGAFSLIGSDLVMPYYSFGNKFGRISKE